MELEENLGEKMEMHVEDSWNECYNSDSDWRPRSGACHDGAKR